MKIIFEKVFAFIFKIFNYCSAIDNKKITFIMTHDDKFNGNLKYIYEEIIERYPEYKINIISRKDYDLSKNLKIVELIKSGLNLFFIKNYNLATSKYVFLNNIFITSAYLRFKNEVKVIQVWHAIGTFKKFGEEYSPDSKIDQLQKRANQIYTEVWVCSKKDIDIYSKAFHISKDKIKVVGSPNCTLFDNKARVLETQEKLYNKYPKVKNKRVFLYAPTFRDKDEDNLKVISYIKTIGENLSDNSILLIRLHPHIYKKYNYKIDSDNIIDVSKYEDVIELMTVADTLITDYSSVFYEFSYLEKPIVFFAFDLEQYERERGFYYDYKGYVPGCICYSINELIIELKKDIISNKSAEFKKYYFEKGNSKIKNTILETL